MEMTSSILRFALATYFMKHSGRPFPYHVHDTSSWPSASSTSSFCPTPTAALCREDENELSSKFSDVVSTHMSNLRQLLVEQRLEEWSKGVMELREYVATNGLVGAFVTLLVELLERHEQDAVSIVQVLEHICFEKHGEPSQVFDQMMDLIFQALRHCCENKNTAVTFWLLRAINSVVDGLRQHQEQKYTASPQHQLQLDNPAMGEMITRMIHDCLAKSGSAART
ncbi:unnamed protein product [Hyaloperonospora brassicae]|uniref:Tuberin N-terminal domain-containing protein n=1 Tax=Hyaloperonospora brassicae TaxID=162125 RepID=A0AAV0TVR1_HYABA|nr:unnamed protein product [Hyaloperonospora brassicae]